MKPWKATSEFPNRGSVKPTAIVSPTSSALGRQQPAGAPVAHGLGQPEREEHGEEPGDPVDLQVGGEPVRRPLRHVQRRAAELKRAVEDPRHGHRIQAEEHDAVVDELLARRSQRRALRHVAVVDVRDLVQDVDRRPRKEDRQQQLQVHERQQRHEDRQRQRGRQEAPVAAAEARLHERVRERRIQMRAADQPGDDEVHRRLRDPEPMKEQQGNRDECGAEDEQREVPGR